MTITLFNPRQYRNTKQLTKAFGISRQTLIQWVAVGKLPPPELYAKARGGNLWNINHLPMKEHNELY